MQFSYDEVRVDCVQMRFFPVPPFSAPFRNNSELEHYTHSLARDGTYGDELCIHAFRAHFSLQVTVYHPDHKCLHFGNQATEKIIHVAYKVHNHESWVVPAGVSFAFKGRNSPLELILALFGGRGGGGQTVEESIFLLGRGGGCFGVSIPPWSGQSCVRKG